MAVKGRPGITSSSSSRYYSSQGMPARTFVPISTVYIHFNMPIIRDYLEAGDSLLSRRAAALAAL